jgi:hypothetical protein
MAFLDTTPPSSGKATAHFCASRFSALVMAKTTTQFKLITQSKQQTPPHRHLLLSRIKVYFCFICTMFFFNIFEEESIMFNMKMRMRETQFFVETAFIF